MLLRSVQQEEQQQADSVTSCVRALRRPPPLPELERAINALDVPEAGLVRPGEALLDLNYEEDSTAETDANFVITGSGGLVEVQGSAEGAPFSEAQLLAMLGLARKGVADLVKLQKQALA